jgi:gliding motility-associated-like protein
VSDTSDAVAVDVLPLPASPVAEDFSGSVCLGAQGPITLCVTDATLTPGAVYEWTYQGVAIAAAGTASCITITDFTGFSEGLNAIAVTAQLQGCDALDAGSVDVQMYEAPQEEAEAGPDASYCLDDEILLSAQIPTVGTGMWSSTDPSLQFENEMDPFSGVDGLSEGENILIWTLDFESCLDYSSDTSIVSIESTPIAETDSILVQFGETVEFNIATNDLIQGGYTIRLLPGGPLKGNVLYQGQGRVIYDPNLGFVGTDVFTYEICSEVCPDQCTTAEVILRVGDENDCFIPSLFTPNGDGTNDRLIIPCLETARFPTNRIVVFNEWGDAVFEAQPYLNNWEGTRNGKDLPVATYFYIVDFGDGRPVQTGFLILER